MIEKLIVLLKELNWMLIVIFISSCSDIWLGKASELTNRKHLVLDEEDRHFLAQ